MLDKLKNKIVLVTGAAGFLGSHAVEELLRLDAKVIAVDDFSQGKEENLKPFLSKITFIKADCNSLPEMTKLFKKNKIDYVLHYAATVGVIRTVEHPIDVLSDIENIKIILELSHKNKVKKLVFASSSEVDGEPVEIPEKEEGPLNVKMPYAAVKLVGELYCKAYWDKYKLPTTSLRFFNVFGPRQDSSNYGFVTGIFIKQVLQNKAPTIFGDGLMTRNFVFVKDNILATLTALVTDEANGETINIGTGKSTTVLDLARKIIAISGKKLKPSFQKFRKGGEIIHREPDVTKMKKLLKYTPQYSLNDALQLTYDWYKNNL
jgi:UDP-glucose 4-epimerase